MFSYSVSTGEYLVDFLVDKEQWSVFPDALTKEYTKELSDRASQCLHQLHQDYLPQISTEDFFCNYMGHTSVYAKLLAYRFFTTEIFLKLRDRIQNKVKGLYGPGELLLHPIFYLRFAFPGNMSPVKYRDSFLGSQPHYDRAYSLYAFSFWTALENIDEQTGGLCFFSSKEVIDVFKPGVKNRYNLDLYNEAAAKLDPLIKSAYVQPSLLPGSILTFDSNTLHGATKPTTKDRVSMDFRLVWASEVEKGDPKTREIVRVFNTSPTYCNAMNLLSLKDFIGAARQMKLAATELESEHLDHLAQALAKLKVDPELQKPFLQMKWQEEYQWI